MPGIKNVMEGLSAAFISDISVFLISPSLASPEACLSKPTVTSMLINVPVWRYVFKWYF